MTRKTRYTHTHSLTHAYNDNNNHNGIKEQRPGLVVYRHDIITKIKIIIIFFQNKCTQTYTYLFQTHSHTDVRPYIKYVLLCQRGSCRLDQLCMHTQTEALNRDPVGSR